MKIEEKDACTGMYGLLVRIGIVYTLCVLVSLTVGCSTYGGEVRFGWVPINQLDAHQQLINEDRPRGR